MATASIKAQLIGAWSLQSFIQEDESGNVSYPFGEQAQGIIMYTPDGYMSAQIMRGGAGDAYRGLPGTDYLAYSGAYHITADEKMLLHLSTVCNMPEWLGREQERPVHIDGDLLYLDSNGPTLINGQWFTLKLVWKRNIFVDPELG